MVIRSRRVIYFDVLKTIEEGTDKPSRIMYEANLSGPGLCSVFDTLINGDFIREEKKMSHNRYYITEKGRNALGYHLKSLEGLIKSKGFPIDSVNQTGEIALSFRSE